MGTITRPALTADAFGTASFATVSALIGVALTVAKTLGPVTAGLLRTTTGDYTLVLALMIGAFLAAVAAAWRIEHDGREEPPQG